MDYSKAKFHNEYDFDVPIGAFDIPLSLNFPFPKGLNLTTGAIATSPDPVAKLDPNTTEQYASNFKEGQANMNEMQDYFKGQKNGENLAIWAAANPALGYKEYLKGMDKEKADDMAAYKEDYGSPMNQQSEVVFEQGKPTMTTTSQFEVLNNPNELGIPGKSAYDLAISNDNFIGQRDIPETANTQDFLSTQMKKYGLTGMGGASKGYGLNSLPGTGLNSYGVDMEGSFPQYPIEQVHGSYPQYKYEPLGGSYPIKPQYTMTDNL